MEWFDFKDKLIHRRWGARDSAAQSRQLGFTSNSLGFSSFRYVIESIDFLISPDIECHP